MCRCPIDWQGRLAGVCQAGASVSGADDATAILANPFMRMPHPEAAPRTVDEPITGGVDVDL